MGPSITFRSAWFHRLILHPPPAPTRPCCPQPATLNSIRAMVRAFRQTKQKSCRPPPITRATTSPPRWDLLRGVKATTAWLRCLRLWTLPTTYKLTRSPYLPAQPQGKPRLSPQLPAPPVSPLPPLPLRPVRCNALRWNWVRPARKAALKPVSWSTKVRRKPSPPRRSTYKAVSCPRPRSPGSPRRPQRSLRVQPLRDARLAPLAPSSLPSQGPLPSAHPAPRQPAMSDSR